MIACRGDDDWQTWPDRKFQRLEWAATGEKLTRETFAKYRTMGGYYVDFNNTEDVVASAVADPLTMIASDGILHDGAGHPRVAGTFARLLGRYVREQRRLTLVDALRKITIEPARRLARLGSEPRTIMTDKLGSYAVAHRELLPGAAHDTRRYANYRAELSHQPTRVREREMTYHMARQSVTRSAARRRRLTTGVHTNGALLQPGRHRTRDR